MKKTFLLITLIFSTLFINFGFAQETSTTENTSNGITFFEGTIAEALELAEKENKLVFVDAYASWCKPCIVMAKTVFMDQLVADYFNANFINIKLDIQKDDEGPAFKEKHEITGVPSFLFLNTKGAKLYSKSGMMDEKTFIKMGKKALKKKK